MVGPHIYDISAGSYKGGPKRVRSNFQDCIYIYYIKNDYSPSQMGGYWSYRLTISYDDEEFSRIFENTHLVRSTVTERKAREGILDVLLAKWNEHSPLVFVI